MWYLKDKGFILLCKYQKAIIVKVIITIHLNEILKENSNFSHSTPWCSWYRSTYVQCIVLFPKLLHVCTMVSNTFLMSISFSRMTQFIDFEFTIATSPESWPFYIGSYVLFKYLLSPTDVCTGYSFWDRLRNFLHKFTWIFLSVH